MKRFVSVTIVIILMVYLNYIAAWGSSTGISGHTEGCGGYGCHALGESETTVTISGPDTLTAGESGTYMVRVLREATLTAGGGLDFKVSAGELSNGDNTKLINNEITHSTDTSTNFTFTVTAPQSGVDVIELSGAALAANLDHSVDGDAFKVVSKVIQVEGGTTTTEPTSTTTTLLPTTTTVLTTTTQTSTETQSPTTQTTNSATQPPVAINTEPPTNTTVSEVPSGGGTTTTTTIWPQAEFSDAPKNAWFYPYITNLASKGAIGGYPDNTFKPGSSITRAEFAKMVCLNMGWNLENPAKSSLRDIKKDDWSYRFIETARSHGLIGGYPDRSFRPDKNISRAEIAKMLAKSLNLPSGTSKLKDIKSCWAKQHINACFKAGLIGGYSNNTFKPNNAATRAEAAKMVAKVVYRFDIISAQVKGDRVNIDFMVNGEARIFSIYRHNADLTIRTNSELVEKFKTFSVERLRSWGFKPNATVDDIRFTGLEKLSNLRLES